MLCSYMQYRYIQIHGVQIHTVQIHTQIHGVLNLVTIVRLEYSTHVYDLFELFYSLLTLSL